MGENKNWGDIFPGGGKLSKACGDDGISVKYVFAIKASVVPPHNAKLYGRNSVNISAVYSWNYLQKHLF